GVEGPEERAFLLVVGRPRQDAEVVEVGEFLIAVAVGDYQVAVPVDRHAAGVDAEGFLGARVDTPCSEADRFSVALFEFEWMRIDRIALVFRVGRLTRWQ